MSITSSPPPDASGTARGLVNLLAQTFSGVKTFTNGLVASAAVTINALLTVGKAPVVNEPAFMLPAPVSEGAYGIAGALGWTGVGSHLLHTSSGLRLYGYAVPTTVQAAFASAQLVGGPCTSAGEVATKVGTNTADASVNTAAKLLSVRTGIGGTEVEKAYFAKDGGLWNTNGRLGSFSSANVYVWCDSGAARLVYSSTTLEVVAGVVQLFDGSAYSWKVTQGRIDQSGTDSSGTPGAATINKPSGKSAIAAGATSVVITNSLVAAGDQVHITWHGDHGQIRDWVTTAAGNFTVNLNAAASANTAFCWTVAKRL